MKNIANVLITKCRKLMPDISGTAALEFVLCVPVLLTIFFGTVEVSRYYLALQKIEKTADMIADVVARADSNYASETLTASNLQSLLQAASRMMEPFPLGDRGVIIVTSVKKPNDPTLPPEIWWQCSGGGTLIHGSYLGMPSGTGTRAVATLPSSVVLKDDEEMVVGEIYYNFSPITIQNLLGDIQVSRMSFFLPRLDTVYDKISPNCT